MHGMGIKSHDAVTFTATDMPAPSSHSFCRGDAVAYTTRSPDKDTDNEDSIGLIPCDDVSGVLVIADGLGGMRLGDLASKQVIDSLLATVTAIENNSDLLREAILNGVEQAHETITSSLNGAASTVAIVQITDNEIRPYHVGDSVILITGQRGKIKYQSTPHSPVGYAVESGLINEADALYHEERHLISNAIGTDPMHIEVGPIITLAKYDTTLVASDGIYDNFQIDEIIEIIRKGDLHTVADNLKTICQERMASVNAETPQKPDDMSFILYRSCGRL